MNLAEWLLYDAATILVLATLTALLLGRSPHPIALRAAAAVGLAAFFYLLVTQYQIPYDYRLFRLCGEDVLGNVDYYAINPRLGRQLVLNPPTSLPLFEFFAMQPLRKGARAWTIFNVVLGLGLVPLAWRILSAGRPAGSSRLTPPVLALLTAAVMLSQSTSSNLALGQLSILTAFSILLGLRAQAAGRPILAGLCLTVATIKVVTLLPFLLLFTKKRDLPTWVTLATASLGLCLITTTPSQLPTTLVNNAKNIRAMAEEGRVNDYSFAGPSHVSMIALDHALYRLGMRNRGWIGGLQIGILAVLGIIVWRKVNDPDFPRGAAASLVAIYSLLFLYHRIYDAAILVLPLVYCVGRSLDAPSVKSRLFALCAALQIAILFQYQRFLAMIEAMSFNMNGAGPWLRGLILPASTWAGLLAMLSLVAASRVGGIIPAGHRFPLRARAADDAREEITADR